MNGATPRLARVLGAAALAACALAMGGCPHTGVRRVGDEVDVAKPTPAYERIAAIHNARVSKLTRIAGGANVGFKGVDADGERISEQGEGFFRLVTPRKLYLTVGKAGQTGFELGSNDTEYWWIDVQKPMAVVGSHAKYSGRVARRAGLPIHPLDMLELSGLTPLPTVFEGAARPVVTWVAAPKDVPGGQLVEIRLRETGRSGTVRTRVLGFTPGTYELRTARYVDSAGRTMALAELSDYGDVKDAAEGVAIGRIATRVVVSDATRGTEVTLWLYDLEDNPRKIKDRMFDFGALCREYRVDEIVSLDEGS